MVGIPGKSRGCATCRARKKKCDLQRPFCGNCLSTSRLCQGYECYPVFLNRTAAGLEKRTRLDEVRAPTYTRPPSSPTHMKEYPSITPPMFNNLLASQRDFVQWFRLEFVYAESGRKFLRIAGPIFSLASPGPLLDLSMQGLAMTRFGRICNDSVAYRRGQAHYVSSLQQLREAIGDTTQSKMEETLASVMVICLVELLESKTMNVKWESLAHMTGVEALLVHRGPHQNWTPISLAVFEFYRKVIMMNCLLERKSSPLGSQEWLQQADMMFVADTEHQLCTLGFRFASLVSQFDAAQEKLPPTGHLKNLVYEIEQLYHVLSVRHRDCSCLYPGQVDRHWHPLTELIEPVYILSKKTKHRTLQCMIQMAMQLECCQMIDNLAAKARSADDLPDMRVWSCDVPSVLELSKLRYNIEHLSEAILAKGAKGGKGPCRDLARWAFNLALHTKRAD